MDIYTFIIMIHVVGVILGTGGATLAELQITKALKNKDVSPDERSLMHVNYSMIRVGMGLILISVLAMFWYFHNEDNSYLFTSEKLWIKDLMLVAIFVNAVALTKRWVPLWLGASISFTSWWGATLLGLAGELPYSFITYFTTYVVAIFAVAVISHIIRSSNINMSKKNILIAAVALAILIFATYRLSYTKESLTDPSTFNEVVVLRELSATIEYDAPGIVHNVKFSVHIDDNEKIQDVAAVELTHAGYEEKLGSFSDNLITTIKGKKLSELEAVDKVGTSSITTGAFNEALEEIQAKL